MIGEKRSATLSDLATGRALLLAATGFTDSDVSAGASLIETSTDVAGTAGASEGFPIKKGGCTISKF